ncbi:MAG: sigma-70 family RNA polymerase sigma factor [Clostridia bacterium]|nr:sigma-70 family RNA polymerase sigma factor [Clostridia bacterium]
MDNGASSYRRFLDGDEAAFDDIMKEYFYGLVFFIDRYVRDTHAAEDIAMDTFCELIVNKHRYNFRVSLKTYLYMMGRSRAIDYIRHKRVIKTTELSDAADLSDSKSLEELVLTEERKKKVHKAIADLHKDMGIAIHLIYFEEMSYKDAARVMKKSRKQVDNLLYRAKKELRAVLGEDGELF